MTPPEMYELVLLALCVWREARGESKEAKCAVASVIRNRAVAPKWWGKAGIVSVILCPQQFSSFNPNDPNAAKFPQASDASWDESLEVAADVHSGVAVDATCGATHYYSDLKPAPEWIKELVWRTTIGHHHFYGPSK